MDNNPYSAQSINAHLFLMASLSPAVAALLEQETYRFTADLDESTDIHILEKAFYCLLQDAQTIGLSFDIDPSDYIEDPNAMSLFIECMDLLLPNGLYPLMKKDSDIRTLVTDILRGSLGGDAPIVQVYLSEIAALDGGIPHRAHLVDAVDRLYSLVSQTGVFTDYLRNLLDLLEQEHHGVEPDELRHQAYQKEMRQVVNALTDAINLFEGDADYAELVRIRMAIIKDFSSSENYINYSYLLLESAETLPEELVPRYMDKWRHYYVSHRWCYLYYPTRKLEVIDRSFQIIIACMAYALFGNKERYEQEMVPFREKHRDDHVDQKILTLYSTKD